MNICIYFLVLIHVKKTTIFQCLKSSTIKGTIKKTSREFDSFLSDSFEAEIIKNVLQTVKFHFKNQ